MSQPLKTVLVGFAAMLSLMAQGCVETSMRYHGNAPSPDMSLFVLQKGGVQSGTWQTFDITIDYSYSQNAEGLDISGQAVLSEHYQMNYDGISKLDLFLFFLDEDSRVLETVRIAWSMTGRVTEIMTFSQKLTVPSGAKNLSFGYDGAATADRSGGTIFYELPLKKN